MWKEMIKSLTNQCEFYLPVRHGLISAVERSLGMSLPDELKGLLAESNGVLAAYGLGLIWPIERIESDNLEFRQRPDFRELYMPFDSLLFFADAGNGDQFAFTVLNGVVRRPDVFVWNHEDDSRTWVAPSLQIYLEWWLGGKLSL